MGKLLSIWRMMFSLSLTSDDVGCDLPVTEPVSFRGLITVSATEASLLLDPEYGMLYLQNSDITSALDSLGANWSHICLSRALNHAALWHIDFLHLRNTLTYLLTYRTYLAHFATWNELHCSNQQCATYRIRLRTYHTSHRRFSVLGSHTCMCHTTTHSHDHPSVHTSVAAVQSDRTSAVAVLRRLMAHRVEVVTAELVWQLPVFVMSWDHHTPTYTHAHTHTNTYRFLSGCEEVEHHTSQLSWTSQLPTTSQHHSPTQILPINYTNIRIHDHTTPTLMSSTWTCKKTMVRGFSYLLQ